MRIFLTFILLITSLWTAPSLAKPKNIILIRHGEKIPGENHINQKGFERSAALAYYFSGTPLYNNPPIGFVFATDLLHADSSVRPIQTCAPTANHYNLPLNIKFDINQTKELAEELLTNSKYDGSTVLICWTHGSIRDIALALGAPDPGHWPKDVFDQVYFIQFEGNKPPTLQKILQKLMFGDRATFADSPPPLPPRTKKRVHED